MLTKEQKIRFVAENSKLLKSYKVIGIVQLSGIPDRLLQSTKNGLRDGTRFIIGRKTLLTKVLESDAHAKHLVKELSATSAIILSNEDPFELYGKFRANSLRLAAKPGQIAQEDVSVVAGETGIQPGQTVTDLKTAGIDVQIQKGKVVIAKDKVLVAKGEPVTLKVAKALHILDILPFKAVIEPSGAPERQHSVRQGCAGHKRGEHDPWIGHMLQECACALAGGEDNKRLHDKHAYRGALTATRCTSGLNAICTIRA